MCLSVSLSVCFILSKSTVAMVNSSGKNNGFIEIDESVRWILQIISVLVSLNPGIYVGVQLYQINKTNPQLLLGTDEYGWFSIPICYNWGTRKGCKASTNLYPISLYHFNGQCFLLFFMFYCCASRFLLVAGTILHSGEGRKNTSLTPVSEVFPLKMKGGVESECLRIGAKKKEKKKKRFSFFS